MHKTTILVAWDFTKNAYHSLSHALFYAELTNQNVCLLHIVKKEAQVAQVQAALEKDASNIKVDLGATVQTLVKVNNMTNGLKEAVVHTDATMIFGCVPGFTGLKKFIGRYVMNAILGSVIPSIVVQENKKDKEELNIICPIDCDKHSKELLAKAQLFAQNQKVKIHLVYPDHCCTIQGMFTNNNINFSKTYLKRFNINFTEKALSCKNFNEAVLNHAKENNADLILKLTTKESKWKNLFRPSKTYQFVANNQKIPVMCIRAKKYLWRTGGFN